MEDIMIAPKFGKATGNGPFWGHPPYVPDYEYFTGEIAP